MKEKSRRSRLGLQLSIVIGLLGFASVAIAGLLISRDTTAQLNQNKGTAMAEVAYQVADKLDRGMYERLRDMKVLASLQTIKSTTASPAEKRALLDSLKASFTDYAFIGLTDANGKVIASANGLLQGASVAARPWFIDTKTNQKPTINDVHEALLLAKLLPNPTNEPLRFVDFSVPVYDAKNTFSGVLGSHLSFSWADDVRTSVLESVENKENVQIFILSSENKVLLGPANTQGSNVNLDGINQDQPTGQFTLQEGQGTSWLVGYAKSMGYKDYAGFGWKVVVRQPATMAFQAAQASQITAIAIAVLVGLAFMLSSILYVRRYLKKEEQLERAKDEFVSLVSHQLRTPLASIRWFSELALDEKGKLNAAQKDALENIQLSTVNMIKLVTTMLNISRIELGRLKIEPQPTNITELIERNIKEVEPLAKEKNVAIHTELDDIPAFSADPLLMSQIVHNLLTNAIRYSRPSDAQVTISARLLSNDFELRVADNGIGIPKAAQKRLFERFYRADNAKQVQKDGTGLGLYLIKIILKQAGGNIAVDSQEGGGTTFIVTLPKGGMRSKEGEKTLA